MRTEFVTHKGTKLPLLNLKGKEYLQVQHRLVWMREEHPDWSVSTSFLRVDETAAIAKAEIKDGEGKLLSTAHKTETPGGFGDFVEKAETGAIGRALAFAGYGTQFCADELHEGERIVDSPVNATLSDQNDLGSYVIKTGKKFNGKRLDQCDVHELAKYPGQCRYMANKEGKTVPAHQEAEFEKIDAFLKTREFDRTRN